MNLDLIMNSSGIGSINRKLIHFEKYYIYCGFDYIFELSIDYANTLFCGYETCTGYITPTYPMKYAAIYLRSNQSK